MASEAAEKLGEIVSATSPCPCPEHRAERALVIDSHPLVRGLVEKSARIHQFFCMVEAGYELDHAEDGKKLEDHEPLVHFMGNGASDVLTVGDFRSLRTALAPWLPRENWRNYELHT